MNMNDQQMFLVILTTIACAELVCSVRRNPIEPFVANQCMWNDDDVVRNNVSYSKCIYLCKALTGCKAISFWQRSTLCRQHLHIGTPSETKSCVYSKESDWKKKTPEGCTETSCPTLQSCHVENGQAVCHVEGCPILSTLINGQTLGNMARLGTKRKHKCNKDFILSGSDVRTCERAGWSGTDPWCNGYLVSGENRVPDSALTASSIHDNNSGYFSPKYARLNTKNTGHDGSGAWTAKKNSRYQYIQVKFSSIKLVVGVALQGRDHAAVTQFVTQFKVKYSRNCINFTTVMDQDGTDKVFPGNTDKNTIVTRPLPEEIRALCVKINPVEWKGHISLRFDVIGRKL